MHTLYNKKEKGGGKMKIGTLLRAGGLAVEIFNHPSTRQLSSMVRKGMERRGIWDALAGQSRAGQIRSQETAVRGSGSSAGGQTRPNAGGLHASPLAPGGLHASPLAPEGLPIRKALQYVTPENVQKAAQWHGILKSLIDKK
jgi:hypothetical protein